MLEWKKVGEQEVIITAATLRKLLRGVLML